jgi:hypothetical protein
MDLITRSAWGARSYRTPSGAIPYAGRPRGVKVHYLGTAYSDRPHAQCAGYVRQLQASHMDGNGWSDIGYSFVVCSHGPVYEGRGLRRRNSANGGTSLNEEHYAVCALLGSSGLTQPPDAQLHGIRDAIEYCRTKGPAGSEIKGHRDGYATACPGGPLYTWVRGGAPRPEESDVALTKSEIKEIAELSAARVWQKDGVIERPNDGVTGNPYWAGKTYLRYILNTVRAVDARIRAQDVVLAQLAAALADRDQVDPDALIARIRAELASITITLSTED